MATEPTNPIIRIAEYDTVLPSTGLSNKLEPVTSVKQTGFDANILLSAENLNYILDNIGEWLQYCKDVADSQVTAGNGLDSDTGTIGEGQTISLGEPSTLSGATENTVSPSSHTHKLDIATLSEARLGISNTKIMTPYLVKSSFNMVGMIVYGAFLDQLSGEGGWLKANGAAVSRTAYGDLFAKIGTVFGSGDGSTTFNLPDLRGEFIRVLDDGRGVDIDRSLGRWQPADVGDHSHMIPSNKADPQGERYGCVGNTRVGTAFTDVTGGRDNRPRNIALTAWIRY